MPVVNLKPYSILDAMKPDLTIGKFEDGNDSLDTFIRQAIGKEPVLSFPKPAESPVQWIQLLQALDYQGTNKISKNNSVDWKEYQPEHFNGVSPFASEMNDINKDFINPLKSNGVSVRGTKSASEHMQTLKIPETVVAFAQAAAKANGEPEKYMPGWPLLTPPKVDLQKCDKCAREFCSPINHRRHKRVHRRALNTDKDFPKNRDCLGVFWDKLSLEDAMEIVALGNITLLEVPGSSLVKALTSLINKPNFYSLPHAYVKAGRALLDVVQARPSRFPISSQELFDILDDASEKTFLCAGTAVSMAKFVVDGDATKIVLELRNIVACTCFLLEQKLVEAWVADKDAEALRCQKLLMEEEEAEQKRLVAILERKRLKKLRQKEQQKAKDEIENEETVSEESSSELSSSPPPVETSTPPATPEEPPPLDLKTNEEVDNLGLDNVAPSNAVENLSRKGNVRRPQIVLRRPMSSSHRGGLNGFHSGTAQRQGVQRDQKSSSLNNGHKIWTRKTKADNKAEEINVEVLEVSNSPVLPNSRHDSGDQPVRNENREVLIGSISITLRESNDQDQGSTLIHDNQLDQNKIDPETHGPNGSVKHWRPVGKHEGPNTTTVEESPDPSGLKLFCSRSAEAFLTQRWKDAIAADHVRLVLSPENEPPNGIVVPEPLNPNILRSSENRMSKVGPVEPGPDGAPKIKSKKYLKLRYIPKQKNAPNQVE